MIFKAQIQMQLLIRVANSCNYTMKAMIIMHWLFVMTSLICLIWQKWVSMKISNFWMDLNRGRRKSRVKWIDLSKEIRSINQSRKMLKRGESWMNLLKMRPKRIIKLSKKANLTKKWSPIQRMRKMSKVKKVTSQWVISLNFHPQLLLLPLTVLQPLLQPPQKLVNNHYSIRNHIRNPPRMTITMTFYWTDRIMLRVPW